MRIALIILVILHALLHLLGSSKGLGYHEVKGLTMPITKRMGYVWVLASILMLLYASLYHLGSTYSWLSGLLAVLVSQVLVCIFWQNAKFGTIPNTIILLVSLVSLGAYLFQRHVDLEVADMIHQNMAVADRIVNERDIKHLPNPVKMWLHYAGTLDKPYVTIGKVTQQMEMQMNPEQDKWMSARATQYTAIEHPGFVWSVDAKMNNVLGFAGRDKFVNGKAEMLIKLNALVTIVNEKGAKLDEAALQRYLGEMVWFPSLALSPYISWVEIDKLTATATMSYRGTTGSGTFHFDRDGKVVKYVAQRYRENEPASKRYGWKIDVFDYGAFDGRNVPTKIESTWKLEEGDWTWLKLEVTDIEYDIAGGK